MKKKKIVLMLVSIFILTSMTTISAMEKESKIIDTSGLEDIIDLELTVTDIITVYKFLILKIDFFGYDVKIQIKNTGTKPLQNTDYHYIITQIAEYNGEEVLTRTNGWFEVEQIGLTFEPGEIFYRTVPFHGLGEKPGTKFWIPEGSTLTIVVDPDNEIPEENENNNYWQRLGQKSKSTISSDDKFPLFCKLANVGLKLAEGAFYYNNSNRYVLALSFVFMSAPFLNMMFKFMEIRKIQTLRDLSCNCSWDIDDFPNSLA